tara:strand:+ start:1032 stop:1601 length:570 start_codon:yes stop_codon:yes gene_type:complete
MTTLTPIDCFYTGHLDSVHTEQDGTKIYRFAVTEKMTRYATITGPKSVAAAREYIERSGYNFGYDERADDGDFTFNGDTEPDYEGTSEPRLISRGVFSQCMFHGSSMTPPASYPEEKLKYMAGSTEFQWEEGMHTFHSHFGEFKKHPAVKFVSCKKLVDGTTRTACRNCHDRLQTGWRILQKRPKDGEE